VSSTGPNVARPEDTQWCNLHACALTRYDYTNMYPTRSECLSNGWSVCETRYRDDGAGGTLTCWKGF